MNFQALRRILPGAMIINGVVEFVLAFCNHGFDRYFSMFVGVYFVLMGTMFWLRRFGQRRPPGPTAPGLPSCVAEAQLLDPVPERIADLPQPASGRPAGPSSTARTQR